MRLFVAVPLPPAQRVAIAQVQQELLQKTDSRAVRPVAPGNVHLTLQFIGEVAAERVAEIEAALHAACGASAPLALRSADAGCFPNARRPRVIWLALDGDLEALRQLRARVAQGTAPFLAHSDDKPFAPHLTLARVKTFDRKEALSIGRAMQNLAVPGIALWRADTVELVRSELTPRGPVYTTLGKVKLTGCDES